MTGYRVIECDACGKESKSEDGKCPRLEGWVNVEPGHPVNVLLEGDEPTGGYEPVQHLCRRCYHEVRRAVHSAVTIREEAKT